MTDKRAEGEPTVLDWFSSLLRLRPIPIPELGTRPEVLPPAPVEKATAPTEDLRVRVRIAHVRVPAALLLAFVAQIGLASHNRVGLFVGFYLGAALLVGWAVWAGDFGARVSSPTRRKSAVAAYDRNFLLAGVGLAVLAYLTSGDNTFRLTTLVFWIGSILITGRGLWLGELPGSKIPARMRRFLAKPQLRLRLDGWSLLVLAVFGVAAYFRFSRLAEVPLAMWSDHAEKYLDIIDIINGQTSIFFVRNAGREPMQFYATVAAIKWFGASFSFLTLKFITALAGLFTLPFMYLFGKEVGGRWTGLAAMALLGIAFWPNVISRVGLRFSFFPLLLAPALYYMVRGFKNRRQNDFVLTGIFVGLGVYGYTAARITPMVIGLALTLYLVHRVSRGHRIQSLSWIGIAALLAVVVAVPFLRVAYDLQDDVWFRTLTRVSDAERPLAGAPLELFMTNMWSALRMFAWDFGQIWILSLPGRPALDWVIGALFHFGLVLTAIRYLRSRDWVDLFLILSIPILLLPTVLSLAFPGENPHPSRAGGAIIPVFAIAGIALASIWRWSQGRFGAPLGRRIGVGLVGGMFMVSAVTNYDMVIREYGSLQRQSTWNTGQAAEVVESFTTSIGAFEDVFMIAYPHWMDSRLVALLAGQPGADIVLWPDQIDSLTEVNTPQLFMLHPADANNLDRLRAKYPGGFTNRHVAEVDGRDFVTYLVPGTDS
ncbi:MAG: glycosyltransferase family 39 protein [Chloroflexi bacterium]|nr:glycosyltransferase family 39 protein [Chloroflexota bacterium]